MTVMSKDSTDSNVTIYRTKTVNRTGEIPEEVMKIEDEATNSVCVRIFFQD